MQDLICRRADSYKLLSDCYYLPDKDLIDRLKSIDQSKGQPYADIAAGAFKVSDLEALKVDFSRLFVGPFKVLAAPYGSLYLEGAGRIMEDSTIDVRNRYQEEKLDLSLKEVPDHIAVELEFLYFLIFKENEAIKNSDDQLAETFHQKQKSFLETHLGAWILQFNDKVQENAQTEFYKDLAKVTKSFIEKDLSKLK